MGVEVTRGRQFLPNPGLKVKEGKGLGIGVKGLGKGSSGNDKSKNQTRIAAKTSEIIDILTAWICTKHRAYIPCAALYIP
jgi:hypothetical protein